MSPEEQERHDRFLRLFLDTEEALRGFVRAIVHPREDAREVMQQVAAILWRKFDHLETDADFRRWAFGIARLEALSAARDKARDRHTFSEELLVRLADETGGSPDLWEAEREALQKCLQKLPDPQRALVSAAYEIQTPIDEIAAKMGRTVMAVYKSLHRIRMALVECTRRELSREGLP
jgi:RNA polymerase sigma-70 factor (ECF subfamily)